MFEWISGQPAVLLREADVAAWRGGTVPSSPSTVRVGLVHGARALLVGAAPLTTAVPLELGGLLLVSATY